MLSINAARRLWISALHTPYIMRESTAYLTGFLAFKANLKLVDAFDFIETLPNTNKNCLQELDLNKNNILCSEDFTLNNRLTSYIATWNVGYVNQLGMAKL
jgi:hypothetical protein